MPWLTLGSGAMVAQRPLEPLILVRVQAPQFNLHLWEAGLNYDKRNSSEESIIKRAGRVCNFPAR
jgi:hypothetical protein